MSIDYQFVPVDVGLLLHPKAFVAGPEAMGLWLWGMAYAKQAREGGTIPRVIAEGAWRGKDNLALAARLVEAGLWIELENGDWQIFNFEEKSPGRAKSTERVKRHRERQRAAETPETPMKRDETQVERASERFTETSASYSLSSSPSSSGSLEGVQGEGSPRSGTFVLPPPPPLESERPDDPPAWFVGALATLEQTSEPLGAPSLLWLRYSSHRRAKSEREGRPWPLGRDDALHWLGSVVVPEAERRRRESSRPPPASGRFDTRQPLRDPASATWLHTGETGL